MPSAYPVRYRTKSSSPPPRRSGSQRPAAANDNYPPAANDNIPLTERLPVAANDNFPEPVGLPRDVPLPAKVARSLDRYFTIADAAANAAGLFDLVAIASQRAFLGSSNGWTLLRQCQPFPVVARGRQNTNACLTGQAVATNTTFLTSMTEWAYSNPSIPHYRQVRVWTRPSAPSAVPAPLWRPAFDPRLFPEYMPNPNVQAYPYWVLPYRRPSVMPQSWQAGYRYPRTFDWPDAVRQRFSWPEPAVQQYSWPGPSRSPYSRPKPPRHENKPPKNNERERKYRPGKVALGVWAGIGTATEALDLLQLLYRSIPKKWRSKWHNGGNQHFDYWSQDPKTGKWKYNEPPPWIMAMVVFNNIDHVDMSKAIPGFVKMQATDKAYGKASKALNKRFEAYYKATGRPIGMETGPIQFI